MAAIGPEDVLLEGTSRSGHDLFRLVRLCPATDVSFGTAYFTSAVNEILQLCRSSATATNLGPVSVLLYETSSPSARDHLVSKCSPPKEDACTKTAQDRLWITTL